MKVLRKAEAIVFHRALRSIGRFLPARESGKFMFTLCCPRHVHGLERLDNGLPDPLLTIAPEQIFAHLGDELEALCRSSSPIGE